MAERRLVSGGTWDLPGGKTSSSPIFQAGWLAGVDYVVEALKEGTPMSEIETVISVVRVESGPKKKRFERKGVKGNKSARDKS